MQQFQKRQPTYVLEKYTPRQRNILNALHDTSRKGEEMETLSHEFHRS